MIKNLASFRSSSTIKPEIHAVLVTPDKIVATDAFKLVEIQTNIGELGGVTEPILVNLPKPLKTLESITKRETEVTTMKDGAMYTLETVDGTFPNYAAVIPTKEPLAKIRINAEYLGQIAEAFKSATAKGKFPYLDIEFHGEHKPLKFQNKDKTILALLMPVADIRD